MSDWPPELDALIAAPKHHRVLMENEEVRVVETRVEAGDTVPVHTHQWAGVSYLIAWSDFVRRDEHGNVLLDTVAARLTRPRGTAMWQDALGPHSLENVGDGPLHVITVEMKSR